MQKILFTFALLVTINICLHAQTNLLYGSYLGGTEVEKLFDLAIDEEGNIYLCGWTESTNFPTTGGAHQEALAGMYDGFLMKINSNYEVEWSTLYGGIYQDYIRSIDVKNGVLYFSGTTSSPTNIASSNAYNSTLNGIADMMVGAFDLSGQRLWCTYYGGDYSDNDGQILCTDDKIYCLGQTASSSGVATANALDSTLDGNSDILYMELTLDGNLVYSSYFGGAGFETPFNAQFDPNGGVLLCGATSSTDVIASPNAHQTVLDGQSDGFVVHFLPDHSMDWGTYFGGESYDEMRGVDVSESGHIWLVGTTNSQSNMVTAPSFQNENMGALDGFILELDQDGTFLWSSYFGGSDNDYLTGVSCNAGAVAICGSTGSDEIPVTNDAFQPLRDGTSIVLSIFDEETRALNYCSYYGSVSSNAKTKLLNDKLIMVSSIGYSPNMITSDALQPNFAGGMHDGFVGVFELTVSVDEFSETILDLYPNPCSNRFTIKSPQRIKEINLIDIHGANVFSKTELNQPNVQIDISILSSGIYVLNVLDELGWHKQKISVVE